MYQNYSYYNEWWVADLQDFPLVGNCRTKGKTKGSVSSSSSSVDTTKTKALLIIQPPHYEYLLYKKNNNNITVTVLVLDAPRCNCSHLKTLLG